MRVFVALLLGAIAFAQTAPTPGKRYPRLIIRNALVIEGNGTPASGPKDIVIENNRITEVAPIDPVAVSFGMGKRPQGDVVIDASGKYVMPGLINAHAHIHDERGGIPQPLEYEFKTWLACGITTIRDVGSKTPQTLDLRKKSAAGEVVAPRIFAYPMFNMPEVPANAEEARAKVRRFKAMGVDGIKALGLYRDVMAAMADEAHKAGLRIAHHAGVEETNAWDDIKFGITSIEHWYGIPDAAIDSGRQNFPSTYNYNNETDRFRWAGHLWREADPERLTNVLQQMVRANVAWVPTLDIYEASRDLQRAQTQPWFREYLHPTLAKYFEPNPANHGSYFFGWSSTDEAYWKENYRLWFAALRQFDELGGTIGCGDDAGFIYQMYGFGLIRELELKQEAGFQPLKILQQATENNARILGQETQIGRVRAGYLADVLIVDGNPLENLKVLYPTGVEEMRDGKPVHAGGVQWVIKDGFVYSGPALFADVKDIVAKAKTKNGASPATGGSR
ncbi:MAG: amidohydrolase family protein [Acidobacteriaceae bacterium]|nr:amidohydrolase family protein [Acidobacteriaceae bacterium]